jgi:hypothetical protein
MYLYSYLEEIFPESRRYRELLCLTKDSVHEKAEEMIPSPVSERQLQCVWVDSRWRPELLQSTDGEKVTVISPGRWNLEAGPDFLDAVLLVGNEQRRIQGDIEIHIRPADWTNHGHQHDPRYQHVIAHVCFFPGELETEKLPPGTCQISMAEPLKEKQSFSFDNIDITAYPYAVIENTQSPCAEILANWLPDDCEALLDSAGEERLRLKTLQMQQSIQNSSSEQCLYESIMTALGYKQNQTPFKLLAKRIPIEKLHNIAKDNPVIAYSILLGVAGLLPNKELGYDDITRTFIRKLWDHWWKYQSQWDDCIIPQEMWRTDGLRPQNYPVRRLAAAAAIFAQPEYLSTKLNEINLDNPKLWMKTTKSILQTTSVFEYWEHRLTFSGKESSRTTVLLGDKRIASIIINVIIPFLAATGKKITPLLPHLPSEQDNSLIRRTAFNLFGRDHNPTMYNTSLRQQGLLQIFYDFCLNMRNGCPNCKLTDSLKHYNGNL